MNQASEQQTDSMPPAATSNKNQVPTQPLTIEQEQEQKLKMKYPNPQKPGGSVFLSKLLVKGAKKYFDSGDYNMAKSKKQGLLSNNINKGGALPPLANPANNSSTPISQNIRQEASFNSSTDQSMPMGDLNSPSVNTTNKTSTTPVTINVTGTNLINSLSGEVPNNLSTPNNKANASHFDKSDSNVLNTSNPNTTTSPLSSSISNNHLQNPSNNLMNNMVQNSHSSQSISLLSSSISSDKIAQIQINQQCMLDSEEIGHGIPTPECLPQSRKHSIVQSKLATPRLSSN